MKCEYRAHPLMIFNLIKPFLFILFLPVLKGGVQYLLYRRISGILALESAAVALILLLAGLRCFSFRLILDKGIITVKSGFFVRNAAMIPVSRLSSVTATQNPFDALFGAVTYRIDTEAGRIGKPDFSFKLRLADSIRVSEQLYGGENRAAIKFSVIKLAAAAATTSSAVTGLLIGVPVINRVGKLINVALSEMLLDEINTVSESVDTYFPPVVGAVTIIFLIGYLISFLYYFMRNLNFKLFMGSEKIEVRKGFFVRRRTLFKKDSVNNVCIEQTPLMRIFRRFSMRVAVGGYADSGRERAILVPCDKHAKLRNQFSICFPYLIPDGKILHAARGKKTLLRFLWWPRQLILWTLVVSAVLALLFPYFSRLILFLTIVALASICYQIDLCFFSYKFGKLRLGDNIFAQSSFGSHSRELYCDKNHVGIIRILRNPADRRYNTCKAELIVRSESADKIRVRNLNYKDVLSAVCSCFEIEL